MTEKVCLEKQNTFLTCYPPLKRRWLKKPTARRIITGIERWRAGVSIPLYFKESGNNLYWVHLTKKGKLEIKPGPGREMERAGGEYMMKWQHSLSIYVPRISKIAGKKKGRWGWEQERVLMKMQLDNWETNSRTTEKWTKKLPTFTRLRLEKKRHLFFSVCMDKPGSRSWVGWEAGLTWWRVPGKGRCQKNTTTHLLDPLWNKPALVNEPNQKLCFPPCRDWNLGTETVENSLSADSKVWIFPNIDPDVGGCVGKSLLYSFSTVPRTVLYMKQKPNQGVLHLNETKTT